MNQTDRREKAWRERAECPLVVDMDPVALHERRAFNEGCEAEAAAMATTLRELRDIQAQSGNWDYNPYMHGMLNGMEVMLAAVTGEEAQCHDAPAAWLDAKLAASSSE